MTGKKLYDISLTIKTGMLVWPGDRPVSIEPSGSIAGGGSSNVSLLHLSSHAGTHVDAPRHFLPGKPGVDRLEPDWLVGPARVVRFPDIPFITRETLEKVDLTGVQRLLMATRNSALLKKPDFDTGYCYLTPDGAEYLVREGARLVGIDYLSVAGFHEPGGATHKLLLNAGVVILESLDLSQVPPGNYELFCLPLKIEEGDGAPARVFLREL